MFKLRNISFYARLLVLVAIVSFTQDKSFAQQQKKVGENAKKKEKVERSYKRAYAKARKKTIKHRHQIQTDATREMMDVNDRKAKEFNDQAEAGFFERLFKRKRRPKQ